MKSFILVVEDNLVNQELLQDWLVDEGFDVQSVANLQNAFDVLQSRAPQVVLLDVQLGREDGLVLSAWIRSNPAMSHIPIIAVTAHAMMADQQRVAQAGCNACVSKPINFALLREQLREWLASTASKERLSAPAPSTQA